MLRKFTGLFVFAGFVIFAFTLAGIFFLSSNLGYARITDLVYEATVVDEEGFPGVVRIKEQLTFDIRASSTDERIWELWRDLPEEYVDGVKVHYNILSVRRLTVNGQHSPIEFTKAATLYWNDDDYISTRDGFGPNKWYHSKGPYDGTYRFECLMLYVDGLYRETDVFEIEYEMYNASMRYADCSELYLTLYSGDTIKYLNSVSGKILIPKDKMPAQGNYEAHTFGTNSHTFRFNDLPETSGYHAFSFNLNKTQLKFKPYNRYIEFTLISFGEDKHSFTEYASVNNQYEKDVYPAIQKSLAEYYVLPTQFKTAKWIVFAVLASLAFVPVIIILLVDKKTKIKYRFFSPETDYDFYRDIPSDLDPAFASALVFCKSKLSDNVPGAYSATMLNLIRKGYINVERINGEDDWSQENVKIILAKTPVNNEKEKVKGRKKASIKQEESEFKLPPLSKSEKQYHKLICLHAVSGEIKLKDFQKKVALDFQHTASFVENTVGSIKTTGTAEGYFQKTEYKELKRKSRKVFIPLGIVGAFIMLMGNAISPQTRLDLAFGAFFVLGAGFILAAILFAFFSRKYVLLTQKGEDEYSKWRGLYNYLKSETLIKERTVLDVYIWEEYLVYATAFGISENVIKALNVRFPDFLAASSLIIRHPFLCTYRFTRVYGRSFSSSARVATWSSRAGGGGSYGGGGRGGGGGGGGS